MRSIKRLEAIQVRRRARRARLPWTELEAEAVRQGCSPADVFYDRAGRPVPGLPGIADGPLARDAQVGPDSGQLTPALDTRRSTTSGEERDDRLDR